MRNTLLGILGVFLAFVAPTVWERMMDAAAEPAWRFLLCLFALGGIAFVVLSDPIYLKLTTPAQHPWLSTAIVAITGAAVAGSVWWFFVILKPGDSLLPPKAQNGPATTTTKPEQTAIVATSPETVRAGLYVSDMRFTFADLERDLQ